VFLFFVIDELLRDTNPLPFVEHPGRHTSPVRVFDSFD
jgi:hypothetical protein